jgi:hypothetical protein
VVRRARDTDISVRKAVYGQVLRKAIFKDVAGVARLGPSHPTVLSLEFMESIIKKGLRDREGGPRQAAASLVNEWVKAYERELPKPEPDMTYNAEVGVVSLLERFNIMERKDDDLEVIEILLESIFSSRKDITDGLDFGGQLPSVLVSVSPSHCFRGELEASRSRKRHRISCFYSILREEEERRETRRNPSCES